MSQQNQGKIYLVTRQQYDYKAEQHEIESYSIYFVSEPNAEDAKMLSLYLGYSKQCDLLDITKDANSWDTPIDLVDFANNYNIPEQYQIPNKLLFYMEPGYSEEQSGTTIQFTDDQYRILMWHPSDDNDDNSTGRFLDCGIPKSVIICPDELPSEGIKNDLYIITKQNHKSIYVYDGTQYIKIFDENDVGPSGSVEVDDITIRKTGQGVLFGEGADVSGDSVTISGTTYTAGTGAAIYNDYSGNKNVGQYSNVFGQSNVSNTKFSTISGHGNTNTPSGSADTCITVVGESNSIVPTSSSQTLNAKYTTILGCYNTITNGASVDNVSIIGESNQVKPGNGIKQSLVFGESNIIQNYGSSVYDEVMICGRGNDFIVSTPLNSFGLYVFGYVNSNKNGDTYQGSILNGVYIFGQQNNLIGSSESSVFCGRLNTVPVSNKVTGSFIAGQGHTVYTTNYSTVCGFQNTINSGIEVSLFGYNNSSTGSNGAFIAGMSNVVDTTAVGTITIGYDLINKKTSNGSVVMGHANVDGYNSAIFTVGNGTESSGGVVTRSDALRLFSDGSLYLPGESGNAFTVDGESIGTVRTDVTMSADGYCTFSILPNNGQEITIGQDTSDPSIYHTVSSVTITSTASMNYDNSGSISSKATSTEYNCVLIFYKDANITTASDLLTNFTSNGANKIYLLNSDIDITDFDIIHVFIFHDGFNLCALVSGYEE